MSIQPDDLKDMDKEVVIQILLDKVRAYDVLHRDFLQAETRVRNLESVLKDIRINCDKLGI